ncbi:MAG: class I SAM-dependent methyltransferase [Acidobacteriaceae bacterium]
MLSDQATGFLHRSASSTVSQDAPANFDALAGIYRWMEYLSFGPMLERCRFYFLPRCVNARHALILGDGDGRFTARFLATNRTAQADAVDASAAMLSALHWRARGADPQAETRLRTAHADLRRWTPSGDDYDLVVSHFFLDCLTEDELDALIARTLPHLTDDATWLISEFAVPDGRVRGALARLLIRFLYFAFAAMTRLRVSELPDYAAAMARYGFYCKERVTFLGGLLITETWSSRKQ